MNLSKSKAIMLLIAIVVSVSVATNLATNYVTNKQAEKLFISTANRLTLQLQQQTEIIKQFSELLLLIIIGCLIGLIVIAVYLPIFMLGSLI